jgi:hypothetical protein
MALLEHCPQLNFDQFNRTQVEELKWANNIDANPTAIDKS